MSVRVSTGCETSRRIGGLMSVMFSRLGLGPTKDTSDMTSSSRIESIGGLVTWANSCLKYAYRVLFLFDRTGRAESVPIDPVDSSPFWIIGSMMILMSSCV